MYPIPLHKPRSRFISITYGSETLAKIKIHMTATGTNSTARKKTPRHRTALLRPALL